MYGAEVLTLYRMIQSAPLNVRETHLVRLIQGAMWKRSASWGDDCTGTGLAARVPLAELWREILRTGLVGRREVPMDNLLFQLALRGGPPDEAGKPTSLGLNQAEGETMFPWWIGPRPGRPVHIGPCI